MHLVVRGIERSWTPLDACSRGPLDDIFSSSQAAVEWAPSPLVVPQLASAAGADPAVAPGQQQQRRKKVIRSRIGYARGATAGAAPPADAQAPTAAAVATHASLLASPQREASDAGSKGGGSFSPEPAAAGAAGASEAGTVSDGSRPGSHASRGRGRAAASPAAVGSASEAEEEVEGGGGGGGGATGGHGGGNGDGLHHLTPLQRRVERLNLQLDLPPTMGGARTAAAAGHADSDNSQGSTGGMVGG